LRISVQPITGVGPGNSVKCPFNTRRKSPGPVMSRSSVALVRPPRQPLNGVTSGTRDTPRVLVIEDERIVAADLQRMLRQLGYDAYACAPSAARALELAEETPPDVVLADIRIEGPVDGIDTAFQLRLRHGCAVIFLTAHADYLVKPVSAPAVKAAVELALDRQAREASAHVLEKMLTQTSADLLTALNHLPLAIHVEDAQRRIVHVNPACCALFDIAAGQGDLLGADGAVLIQQIQALCTDPARVAIIVDCLLKSRQPLTGDVIQLRDGRTLELDFVPLYQGSHRRGQLWAYRDITVSEDTRKELEQALARHQQEIFLDSLTGLTNRRGFFHLAQTYVQLMARSGQQKRILFFIDLDGLKSINDRYGHPTGDEALCAVAQALRATFRTSDLLVRLGGDEFAVLATLDPHEIDRVKMALAARLKDATDVLAAPEQLSVSVGTAEYLAGDSLEVLLARADQAMYRHKRMPTSGGGH
jgi:diguanylate cyclase (GGDEF)-like protein